MKKNPNFKPKIVFRGALAECSGNLCGPRISYCGNSFYRVTKVGKSCWKDWWDLNSKFFRNVCIKVWGQRTKLKKQVLKSIC